MRYVETYEDRDRALEKIGFEDYSSYLKSPLWEIIRRVVVQRDEYTCRGCSKPYDCVHHVSYSVETLLGLAPQNLVALCTACHRSVEYDDEGKTSLERAAYLTEKLVGRIPESRRLTADTVRRIHQCLPLVYARYKSYYRS